MFKTVPERHREKSSVNVAAIDIIREEELANFHAKNGVKRGRGEKEASLGRMVKMSLLLLPGEHPTWSCLLRGCSITLEVKWAAPPGKPRIAGPGPEARARV